MRLLIFIISFPLLWVVSRLPFALFYRISDFMFFWVNLFGYRKGIIHQNLRLAFPDKSEKELRYIRRKFYAYFCDTLLEMTKTLSVSTKTMANRFKIKNPELLRKLEAENKSVILLCSHYASWEWMIVMGTQMKFKSYGVYQPILNPYFDKMVKEVRGKFNATLMTPKETPLHIIRNQKSGTLAMYGMVSDQSASWKRAHYWRPFMGVKVPVFVGAERIAKRFDLTVIYLKVDKIKRGFYEAELVLITADPKSKPDFEITDIYLNTLEAQIRQRPELYLWSHNRWKHRHKTPAKFAKVND